MKPQPDKPRKILNRILEQRMRKMKIKKGLNPKLPRMRNKPVLDRRRKKQEPTLRGITSTGGQQFQSVLIVDQGSSHQNDYSSGDLKPNGSFGNKNAMIVETFLPREQDGSVECYDRRGTGSNSSNAAEESSVRQGQSDYEFGSGGLANSGTSEDYEPRVESITTLPGENHESQPLVRESDLKRKVSLLELPEVSIVEVGETSESESTLDEEVSDGELDESNLQNSTMEVSLLDTSALPDDLECVMDVSDLQNKSRDHSFGLKHEYSGASEGLLVGKQPGSVRGAGGHLSKEPSGLRMSEDRGISGKVGRSNQEQSTYQQQILMEKTIRVFKHKDDANQCFVMFKKDLSVPFLGKANISILCGEVIVNGFRMTAGSSSHPIYSTHFTALSCLNVSCTTGHCRTVQDNTVKVCQYLETEDAEELREFVTNSDGFCAILLQPLHCHAWDYLTQFDSYKRISTNISYESDIFKKYEPLLRSLGFFLCVDSDSQAFGSRSIRALPGQEHAIGCILRHLVGVQHRPPVIVVCGKKGTGKSTMSRHVVNQLLNRTAGICYIEADVGQSELTPSCLLSLHHVTEPLLGLPFVHQREPERMYFFGCNETKHSPDLYIDMLNKLYRYYTETHSDKPLVVNTNGHVQGVGGSLIKDILAVTRPSQVILLEDPMDGHRFNFDEVQGWATQDTLKDRPPVVLRLEPAPALDSGHVLVRIGPSGHRSLTLMSYFSSLVRAPDWCLAAARPYMVPWSAVAVSVCNTAVSPNHILYALNGSIVGLCDVKPNMMQEFPGATPSDNLPKSLGSTSLSMFGCLGLGIIRGIDPVSKVFYIITPLPAEVLPRVTALIKGTNFLRLPVAMKGLKEEDEVPYVCRSYTNSSGCYVPKKSTKFLIRKRRLPH